MPYKTVNLKPETYQELEKYKVAGMTFDDVVKELMARTDPAQFYADAVVKDRTG